MYGSIINRLQERMFIGAPEPFIGMGVTMTSYSDRHAGTIIAIKKVGKGVLITVQSDTVKRIDKNGMSESQEYEYTPNPDGAIHYYKQREPNTRWVHGYFKPETGKFNKASGGLFIGERDEYYDFSF
jgi:hypothetical protein